MLAEAFNLYSETGLSPRQFAEDVDAVSVMLDRERMAHDDTRAINAQLRATLDAIMEAFCEGSSATPDEKVAALIQASTALARAAKQAASAAWTRRSVRSRAAQHNLTAASAPSHMAISSFPAFPRFCRTRRYSP
jgi:hypothetical protein